MDVADSGLFPGEDAEVVPYGDWVVEVVATAVERYRQENIGRVSEWRGK